MTSGATPRSRVSVVIPAHNAAPFIAECLDSVLAQTCPPFEVIVLDDGSTDDTPAVVERYRGRVRCLRQERSLGPAATRNRGVDAASGEYVAFIDADDVMRPDRLERQVGALSANPGVPCVLTDYRNFGAAGPWPRSHFDTCPGLLLRLSTSSGGVLTVLDAEAARTLLVEENFGSTCGLLFRRDAFLRLGGFDASLQGSEDFDLIYRSALVWPLGVLRTIGFDRRLHGTNLSFRRSLTFGYKARSRRKLARREPVASLRSALVRAVGEYQLDLAEELGRRGRPGPAFRALLDRDALRHAGSVRAARAVAWCVVSLFRCAPRDGKRLPHGA